METEAVKPVGGFVFVSAMGLLAAWWAYKRRFIQFRDFRAWLACHELLAERCRLEEGQIPHFEVKELGRFVGGVGGEHLRASVRRLERAGLLAWSQTSVQTANSVSDVRVASGRCRAMGHLLRCLYHRGTFMNAKGLCKASWIAEVFEVSERNVKAARSELVGTDNGSGFLVVGTAPQRVLNRYGLPVTVNLTWSKRKRSTPPQARSIGNCAPPLYTRFRVQDRQPLYVAKIPLNHVSEAWPSDNTTAVPLNAEFLVLRSACRDTCFSKGWCFGCPRAGR